MIDTTAGFPLNSENQSSIFSSKWIDEIDLSDMKRMIDLNNQVYKCIHGHSFAFESGIVDYLKKDD